MAKKLLFTVNLGGYDNVAPLLFVPDGYDCILFTDNPNEKVEGWQTEVVKQSKDLPRQSRDIKIQIHKYVKGYKTYVYIDGNVRVVRDLSAYVAQHFRSGLLLHAHRNRDCIFEEAKTVIKLGLDEPQVVDKQMRRYSMEGMKRRYGLFQNNFLIRDNSVNKFCELWFEEVKNGSRRDQLSLPYLMFKHKPEVHVIQPLFLRRFMIVDAHAPKISPQMKKVMKIESRRSKSIPKVWYFVPGRGDKNLGQSYNDHCELVPDDDWICIRDGDTMFLNPYWSRQIEDIIAKHGHKYPLISCTTNRLGLDWQLPYGFRDETDIMFHMKLAEERYEKNYDEVTACKTETAGLFMLFPKSTWKKCKFEPGLVKGGVFVDYAFAHQVRAKLGNIGIAQGIYLFHLYRMGKNKRNIDHLK